MPWTKESAQNERTAQNYANQLSQDGKPTTADEVLAWRAANAVRKAAPAAPKAKGKKNK